jgi:hypothetical protein
MIKDSCGQVVNAAKFQIPSEILNSFISRSYPDQLAESRWYYSSAPFVPEIMLEWAPEVVFLSQ